MLISPLGTRKAVLLNGKMPLFLKLSKVEERDAF